MNIVTDEMVEIANAAYWHYNIHKEWHPRKSMRASLEAVADRLQPAVQGEAVATVTVSQFRGQPCMENRDFEYFGNLPDGTHALYTRPADPAAPVAQGEAVAEIGLSDDGYKIGYLIPLQAHRLSIGTKLYMHPAERVGDDEPKLWSYDATGRKDSVRVRWPDEDDVRTYVLEDDRVGVPDELPIPDSDNPYTHGYMRGWNDCRAAMLAKGDA